VRNYHALERKREENDLEILEDRKLIWSLKTYIYIYINKRIILKFILKK